MKKIILTSTLALILITSVVQAATVSGWTHPDYISADITATYSAADSSLLLTVTNTSPATSAYLRGLLFSAPDVTLTLTNVSYYSQSVAAEPIDMTNKWSLGTVDNTLLNADPVKPYDEINTALYTGNNFEGGNPKAGIDVGWTATFQFNVAGSMDESLNQFVARFQSINYPGITGSDSDFAAPLPTPVPGSIWLLGAAVTGIITFRRKLST